LPLALAALGVGAGLSSTFAALMPLRWALTALSSSAWLPGGGRMCGVGGPALRIGPAP
jgi:hypothetical protein